MPWQSFIPWSNSLKTRACRQLIHHYLGVFFQEKLSLDQLSVDLFSGRGQVKDVILNLTVTIKTNRCAYFLKKTFYFRL